MSDASSTTYPDDLLPVNGAVAAAKPGLRALTVQTSFVGLVAQV